MQEQIIKEILQWNLNPSFQQLKQHVPLKFEKSSHYAKIFLKAIKEQMFVTILEKVSKLEEKNSANSQTFFFKNFTFQAGILKIKTPHFIKSKILSDTSSAVLLANSADFKNNGLEKNDFLCLGFFKSQYENQNGFYLEIITSAKNVKLGNQKNQRIYIKPLGKFSTEFKQIETLQNLKEKEKSLKKFITSLKIKKNETRFADDANLQAEAKSATFLKAFNQNQRVIIKKIIENQRNYYVIQGPPGCGKTETLIGIVAAEFFKTSINKRKILICTPSNKSLDHIIKKILNKGLMNGKNECFLPKIIRLGQVEKSTFQIRSICPREVVEELLNSLTSSSVMELTNNVKKEIKQCKQNFNKLKLQKMLSLLNYCRGKQIDSLIKQKKYLQNLLIKESQLIFSTTTSSYLLQKDKFTFENIIIDEAGQCSEPNILIPLSLKSQKFTLIGDPQQLAFTCSSVNLKQKNYERSFLGRFSEFGGKLLFLNTQYRMVGKIMQFINQTFYNGRLINSQAIENVQYPNDILKKFKGKELIWINNEEVENEAGTSFYNEGEIDVIVKLTQQLQQHENMNIGIISPYSKMTTKLQNWIKVTQKLNISTVDGYQGQERDVIILSTVRSNFDQNIGFLQEKRRMNVGISRSKFLCIIIGNEKTFQKYTLWKDLLQFIKKNNCFIESLGNQVLHQIIEDKIELQLTPINELRQNLDLIVAESPQNSKNEQPSDQISGQEPKKRKNRFIKDEEDKNLKLEKYKKIQKQYKKQPKGKQEKWLLKKYNINRRLLSKKLKILGISQKKEEDMSEEKQQKRNYKKVVIEENFKVILQQYNQMKKGQKNQFLKRKGFTYNSFRKHVNKWKKIEEKQVKEREEKDKS